jgi:shikimate dehydrogenase
MADRYAVIGNPVAHSLSPVIHARFAEQTGEAIEYEALLAPEDAFAETLIEFRDAGARGANITVPFKQEAWQLADQLSERARLAGAVNTLVFGDDGVLFGDNTDGTGLLNDLTVNHGLELSGKELLILGAGGAVRGVLLPLLSASPARILIANRTRARAEELADAFGQYGLVEARGFDELEDCRPDLVINGTSAGLSGDVPPVPETLFEQGAAAYDMMYGKSEPTAFQCWAEASGSDLSMDGLGMLVEQAAESFYIWRGIRPDTGPVIELLRE